MKKWLAGAAMLGALAGGAVVADAAIPDAAGNINACVSRGGAVRIIDTATDACKTAPSSQAETPLSWPSASSDTDTHLDFTGTLQVNDTGSVPANGVGQDEVTCPVEHLLVRGNVFAGVTIDVQTDRLQFDSSTQTWTWQVLYSNSDDIARGTSIVGYCVPVR